MLVRLSLAVFGWFSFVVRVRIVTRARVVLVSRFLSPGGDSLHVPDANGGRRVPNLRVPRRRSGVRVFPDQMQRRQPLLRVRARPEGLPDVRVRPLPAAGLRVGLPHRGDGDGMCSLRVRVRRLGTTKRGRLTFLRCPSSFAALFPVRS